MHTFYCPLPEEIQLCKQISFNFYIAKYRFHIEGILPSSLKNNDQKCQCHIQMRAGSIKGRFIYRFLSMQICLCQSNSFFLRPRKHLCSCSKAKGNNLEQFGIKYQSYQLSSINTIKCPPKGRSGSTHQLCRYSIMPEWFLWHQHHKMLFDFSSLSSVQEMWFNGLFSQNNPIIPATMYPNPITNFQVSSCDQKLDPTSFPSSHAHFAKTHCHSPPKHQGSFIPLKIQNNTTSSQKSFLTMKRRICLIFLWFMAT